MDNLKYIKDTTWDEVFEVWKNNEGQDPNWLKVAQEKGWNTWEEWRGYINDQFGLSTRQWKLYEILEPNETIPNFLMGPFIGWQKNYPETEYMSHTFADLVLDHNEWVKSNTGINARLKDFPPDVQFIGFNLTEGDKIILYEGHHRASAIALAKANNQPITFITNPTIALCELSEDERHLLNEKLKLGSQNPNNK